MKQTWMGVILVGAVFSSGCATLAGGAFDPSGARSGSAMRPGGARLGAASGLGGARPGAGHTTAYQKGPVHTVNGQDYHSLSDPVAWRPSPASPVGMAMPRFPMPGPDDSPLAEWGILGIGVKGLPGADIRRLGLIGYLKSWSGSGLGRSLADISRDPANIYTYLQFRVFQRGESRLLLY